jgi:hypothetical protein
MFQRRHRRIVNEQAGRIELEDVEVVYQGLGLRMDQG